MGLFDTIKEKLGMGGVSNEAHKPVDPEQHAEPTRAGYRHRLGAPNRCA